MFIVRLYRRIVRSVKIFIYNHSNEAKRTQKRINELYDTSRKLQASISLIEASKIRIPSIPASATTPAKPVEVFKPFEIKDTGETLVEKRRYYQGKGISGQYELEDQFDFLCSRMEMLISEGSEEEARRTLSMLKDLKHRLADSHRRSFVDLFIKKLNN